MVVRKGKSQITFVYTPGAGCRKVEVAGSFNNWQPEDGPMTRQKDGSFRKRLKLDPGEHRYRFRVDDHWADDPDADALVPNGFGSLDAVVHIA